jgi:hypothetical protein
VWVGVDGTAQDRVQWLAFVLTELNHQRVGRMIRNDSPSCRTGDAARVTKRSSNSLAFLAQHPLTFQNKMFIIAHGQIKSHIYFATAAFLD